jgi:apolipoprotein D and lipocalin family protein
MKNKVKSLSLVGLFTTLMMSCAHSYHPKVDYVDMDRFMGTWYVMAGRFTPLERDVFNAVEKYTWNEAKERIDIDFSYNKGSLTGPLKKLPQKGWIEDHKTNATWKISPMWPLKFTYLVVALDPDYEWTAIGVPNKNYLWIMTRSPKFNKDQFQDVLEQLEKVNYPTDNLTYVEHNK